MIIISISKRKLKLFAAAVLAVFLVSFGIYRIFGDQDAENYNELVNMLRYREVAVSGEILEATTPAQEDINEIQIFDISKGKVVKKLKTSPAFQDQAVQIISSITGLYAKVKPLPEKGYIVRVPVNPALKVQNQYINATIDKIYVIFTENEPPFVLILDRSQKPFVYNFSWNTDELVKLLDFDFAY